MSTKHTPEPWKQTENKELNCIFIQSPTGLIIAKIMDFCMRGEAKANAKLIAAAPELLAALKLCLETIQINGVTELYEINAVRRAESAIKKATE